MKKRRSTSPSRESAAGRRAKELADVFAALKVILEPYEKDFQVLPYRPEFYCLVTRLAVHKGKPVWFTAIRMGKNYVSYHLMPVYMNPAMQKRIPPELKKRMQGKRASISARSIASCFGNFLISPLLASKVTAR